MNILAERVTDLLEEQHRESNKKVLESEEYKNFKEVYIDEISSTLRSLDNNLVELEDKQDEIKEQIEQIKKRAFTMYKSLGFHTTTWQSRMEPEEVLEAYLEKRKNEKYPGAEFNRDKTLRRAQADILLSNLGDVTAEELVNQLVNKLK